MGRAPCCDKASVKKGPWSPEEDAKLKDYIQQHGTGGNWIALPKKVGLNRCGKSCRLRWLNYLRPNIRHGGFSEEEDNIICSLYVNIGSRWSIIAAQLPGRTDNDIKNYWNTKLKKKLLGKQRNDQRARPNRRLEMEIKSENYMIREAIGCFSPLQEKENNFTGQTSIESSLVKHEVLNITRNNHYYNLIPSEVSCPQNQSLGNPVAKNAYSMSSINNDITFQIDEIPYRDSQHFDGLENLSCVEMVKSSPMIIANSLESSSWDDISSVVHNPTMSNVELFQEFLPQNFTFWSSEYMGFRQPCFTSMV